MNIGNDLKSLGRAPRIRAVARFLLRVGAGTVNRARRLSSRSRLASCDRLHLGSGSRHIPGWANIDMEGAQNIIWDLRRPLPIARAQIRFVYTEHFIEHITRPDCLLLMRNVRRAMAEGGVLRVSTPDLRIAARNYLDRKPVRMPHGNWYPETPCQMLNECMRLWGHTYLYDEEELTALLLDAGFTRVYRVVRGVSCFTELRGLESRPDFEDLIVEAAV